MSIANLLLNWTGRPDPLARVQAMAGDRTPAPGDPTPAAVGTGAGTGAPAGQPAPAAPPPEAPAYQSPSELMSLYSELVDRQNRIRSINTGIGLMGASLAHPENRRGIIAAMSGMGGGGGNPADLINSLVDFQSKSAALSQKASQRASIPAIAAQYGLDTTTALYLFDSGKLDSVIAELEKPDKQIVQGSDGRSYIVDKKTGEIGDPLGPEKPQELEIVEGPGGSRIVVDKNTKQPVGRDPIVPEEGNTEFERNYRNALAERPDLTREQFRRETNTTTQTTWVDASGRNVGDPPKDMAWDLDEQGNVKIDERNAPIAIPIAGTDIDLKQKKDEQERAAAQAKDAATESMRQRTADIVTTDIDRALEIIEANEDGWIPATGWGGLLEAVPLTPSWQVGELLKTVRANIGFDKLQEMRAASQTGAALGPVSDFENQLLQATLGNLALAQQPETIKYNLRRIKRVYQGVINGEFMTRDANGNVVPDPQAVQRVMGEVDEDLSVEDLLKIYGGE